MGDVRERIAREVYDVLYGLDNWNDGPREPHEVYIIADRILAALETEAEPVAHFEITGDHANDAAFRILLGGGLPRGKYTVYPARVETNDE